jgi:catecholate siderophore receptor
MNEQNLKPLAALLMTQGLAAVAHAQSTNAPAATGTNTTAQLPDVVVQGQGRSPYKPESVSSPKYTEPLLDIPQSITVIPQAVISEQGATTLRDILRNVPGISMQAGEGGVPAGDNLSIRGFNARTDLFVDGVRDFGGYSRDAFNLQQVEVVKGPASSNTGRGSTGGSVNLVSKTPSLAPSYNGSLGIGTDDYYRTTLDVNQPLAPKSEDWIGGTALRLNAMWQENDTPDRDSVSNERWGVAPSLAFGLGTPTRLTLSYFHLQQDNMPDYGIPWVPANTNAALAAYSDKAPPVDYSNFYGLTARDYEETQTDVGTALIEHDLNDSLTLRDQFRYGVNDRDSVITAPRFVNANTSTTINRQLQSRDQTDTILANQIDLTAHFDTGKISHDLITGFEYDRETSVNYARAQSPANATPTTDLYNPNPGDPFNGTIVRTGVKADSTSDTFSLYAFDTMKLGEQWELNGGLRWDYFSVDYANTTNGVGPTLNNSDNMLSWRAGLVFKPVETGSIYVGAGSSFNPSSEGLTLSSAPAAANNVDTDPEETRTIELGTKWEFFRRRLMLTTAIFCTDKFNARTEDPTDPGDVIVLDGEQRVYGVEFTAAGRITDNWQVFGGYTWLHSEITDSKNDAEVGNELANTPEHSFSLWTTYALPFGFEIGGGARYRGSVYSSNAITRQAPDYWVFDGMISYRVSKNLTLQLNGYNLADEEYIDLVGGGHFVPGAGRSGVLSANLSF